MFNLVIILLSLSLRIDSVIYLRASEQYIINITIYDKPTILECPSTFTTDTIRTCLKLRCKVNKVIFMSDSSVIISDSLMILNSIYVDANSKINFDSTFNVSIAHTDRKGEFIIQNFKPDIAPGSIFGYKEGHFIRGIKILKRRKFCKKNKIKILH